MQSNCPAFNGLALPGTRNVANAELQDGTGGNSCPAVGEVRVLLAVGEVRVLLLAGGGGSCWPSVNQRTRAGEPPPTRTASGLRSTLSPCTLFQRAESQAVGCRSSGAVSDADRERGRAGEMQIASSGVARGRWWCYDGEPKAFPCRGCQ